MRQYDWYPTVYHNNFREYMEYLGSFGDRLAVCWYDRGGQGYEKTYRQLHEDVAALRKAPAGWAVAGWPLPARTAMPGW